MYIKRGKSKIGKNVKNVYIQFYIKYLNTFIKMKYFGGKSRIGKLIATFILNYLDHNNIKYTKYVEPFCGCLGVLSHISADNRFTSIYASDIHPDLILMWKGLQNGTFNPPLKMPKSAWEKLRNKKEHSALRAFAGFLCSFNGQFFSSYAKNSDRIHSEVGRRNLIKMKNIITTVTFANHSYKMLTSKLNNCVIYCDPPYIFDRCRKIYEVLWII